VELRPDDLTARDYLLSTFIDAGRYEGAIKYFEDRLAKDANDVEAVAQLANINSQAGKWEAAIQWHAKRAELEPGIDAKADAWYSIGVLDWRRLNNHPEVTGAERARIADEGLAWLQKADQARQDHGPTLSYLNLLYRERAMAHDASIARAVDLANAQSYYKRAVTMAKAPAKPAPAPEPAPR
jgi:tetratricopeptide (TPR) repeat protein